MLLIGLFWSLPAVCAQNPPFVWAFSAGGDSLGIGYGVAVDRLGNSHVVGGFTSSQAAFGSVVLTNAGSVGIFIAKYDGAGSFLWARQAGGSASDEARAIAVDASGNSYVTGLFTSPSATFGGITLTNHGSFDVFVAKYDNTGNVLWAKGVGDSDNDEGLAIAVDKAGNSYVTGVFAGSPGGGIWDMFIAKYDSAGTLLWFKRAGGAGDDRGNGIALDGNGNIYVVGAFASPTLTFESTTLTNAGSFSAYLAKYDSAGNFLWVRQTQGSGNDGASGVGVDATGNVYMTGGFSSSSISFGGITITNSGPSEHDIFVAKYDPDGNILWAKQAGGAEGFDYGSSIAVTETGSSYVSGFFGSDNAYFNGDIEMDPKIKTSS